MNKPPLLFRHPVLNQWIVYLAILTPGWFIYLGTPFSWGWFAVWLVFCFIAWGLSGFALRASKDKLRKWRYAQIADIVEAECEWPYPHPPHLWGDSNESTIWACSGMMKVDE